MHEWVGPQVLETASERHRARWRARGVATGAALALGLLTARALAQDPEGVALQVATPTMPSSFVGLQPCRLADTRTGSGFTGPYGPPSMAANVSRDFPVTGQCGVPADAVAVSVNLTSVNALGAGHLRAWPAGDVMPAAALLLFTAGQSISNGAVLPLGLGGAASVVSRVSGSDLVIDIVGYHRGPVVRTLNGQGGDLNLLAGTNVTITPAGNDLTISASGGGDITAVNTPAGSGLTGGAASGSVTLGAAFGGSGVSSSVSRSDHDHAGQSWSGSGTGLTVTSLTSGETGLFGWAAASSGTGIGVLGQSASPTGRGVLGVVYETTGQSFGVFGQSMSSSGIGVYGVAPSPTSGVNYGVWGTSNSSSGNGVYGSTTASSGTNYGVRGESVSPAGYGVFGFTPATSGATRGVAGLAASTDGYAVFGSATASTGSNYGVWGETFSSAGTGVYARALTDGGTALVAEHSANTGSIAAFRSFGAARATFAKNGDLTLAGTSFAVNHVNTSDARLKEDVSTLEGALERLKSLRAVRFRFRGQSDPQIGVIAQELEPLFPELVRSDADGHLAVAYGQLSAVLLAALHEQQALIERLEARLAALETGARSANTAREE